MSVLHVGANDFEKEVLEESKTVLVDFYADWCGPCKMMSPVVEKLAEELGDTVKVSKINVDEAQNIAANYNVMSIPTFIVFKHGEPVKKTVGVQSESELKGMLS